MPTITIDLEPLLALADDPFAVAWFLMSHGGWIVFLFFFIWMAKLIWINHIQMNYIKEKMKPVLLAIDVPKLSVQTPKGVENIFAHLAGGHGSHNRREKYWHGNVQEWFSLEIVSIEGYIQFLVWTWSKYRDLIETAIYAQYPDAQITEVQDYTPAVPSTYPDKEWDLFGTEFVAVKPPAYPIRTWEFFEHKGQKDEPFKDPLAAMLENMARIGPGEQIWLQILAMPIDQKWADEGLKVVKKIIGAKSTPKKTALDTVFDISGKVVTPIFDQVFGASEAAAPKKDGPLSNILYLSTGERTTAELIEKKIAKIGFKTKIRLIYVAKKEVFKKPRGAHAVIGSIKQFNTNDANSLKPEYKHIAPSSLWLFKDLRNNARKRHVYRAYKNRSMWAGMKAHIFNIEELATLWHFPTVAVHAPLIRKTEAKRAEPPTGLPVSPHLAPTAPAAPPDLPTVQPPEGLPIV
ncbi:hypothetical protein HY480_03735 [Candidatus Uhrbacteria bacterium]|nr:hypothetical protein [Candidatus Uhrbacteria bacterium]